jgi:hypothetical protein
MKVELTRDEIIFIVSCISAKEDEWGFDKDDYEIVAELCKKFGEEWSYPGMKVNNE